MHVLVVTVVHHPDDARIRYRQINALLREGHSVTYAAPFGDSGAAPPPGVTAVDVPRAHGRRRLTALLAARRAVASQVADVDLVLVHDPELLVGLHGLRLPVLVWDVHEDYAAAMSLKPWLPRPLRTAAAGAVVVAERWAEHRLRLLLAEDGYSARFRQPHPVVPNFPFVPPFVAEPGDEHVVYLGHVSRARGGLDLIALGEALRGEVRVEVIGSADESVGPAIRAAHEAGLITWRGFVPNDRALRMLEGALAGVSLLHDEPNYRHSRPTKVMEYMARGIPTVTTPLPCARDLVNRHDAGQVVPFRDIDATASAVRRLRDDHELRYRQGRNGHTAALGEFHWLAEAPRFVETLESWTSSVPTPRRGV